MTPWRSTVKPVTDGERVEADISNRPVHQLANQTRHLKEVVDNLSESSGRLVFVNAPVGANTVVLDVVYYDVGEAAFLPAIAEVVQDAASGKMLCGPRSLAIGIITSKSSSTIGTILQLGRMNFGEAGLDPADMIADPINEPFASGRFWLSNSIPGKITSAPVMPAIQVGFFSEGECNVQILHKDLFESHQHHRHPLSVKPSASQNFNQTGWTSFEQTGPTDVKRVDYYNSGSSAVPPQIILCIRHPGGTTIDVSDPARIELFNDGGVLAINKVTGGLDYENPAGAGTTTETSSVAWPAYGEWVSVGFDTGLEIAFIRADADYANTLAVDAAALLTTTAKKFKVFLPQDLEGWTNANTFDLTTPAGALYKYLMMNDQDLAGIFPPLPVSSAIIEMNGSAMVPDEDFAVTLSGIFWKIGFLSPSDYAPWPTDYSVVDAMAAENGRNLTLYFIKSGLDAMKSVVFSLRGISPIKVTSCPDGADAVAGHLQVSIDLGMIVSTATPLVPETCLASVSGVSFERGMLVSELIEGPGIRLENLTPSALFPDRRVGKVRVSAKLAKFEGEFTSVALRNAKEMIAPFGSYIDFIPVSEGASGITVQFKIPNLDIDADQLKLSILSKIRGNTAVLGASADQLAIFKVVYHVLRPGFVMSSMNEGNAVDVQYWIVAFPSGYVASTILSNEYPNDPNNPDIFEINSATLIANPSSLVALDGGFEAGDHFAITIDRVNADDNGAVSSYPGRVGFVGSRWILK